MNSSPTLFEWAIIIDMPTVFPYLLEPLFVIADRHIFNMSRCVTRIGHIDCDVASMPIENPCINVSVDRRVFSKAFPDNVLINEIRLVSVEPIGDE